MKKITFLTLISIYFLSIDICAMGSTRQDEPIVQMCWEGPLSCGVAFAACAPSSMELVAIVVEANSLLCGRGGEENEKLD
jgi:hypothetical protein